MPITRPVITKLAEYDVRNGQSQRATLGLGEVSLTRRFMVKWEETDLVAQHFLGWSRVSGGRLERLLPAAHPDDPALVATRISLDYGHKFLEGQPAQTDQSTKALYAKACITVEYQRPDYTLLEDADTPADEEWRRYTTVADMEATGDSITQPGHTLRLLKPGGTSPLGGTALNVPYNIPKTFVSSRVLFTWKRLPANFVDWWDDSADGQPWLDRVLGDPLAGPPVEPYLGCVNKYKLGRFRPGQLMFTRFRVVRKPAPFVTNIEGPEGELSWQSPAMEQDLEMEFKFVPQTHLKLYYADSPPISGTRTTAGASGWYYAGAGTSYYSVESTPDNYSLANVRDLRHLWRVNAV